MRAVVQGGAGPDARWYTPEDREAGEIALRREFAEALREALRGERRRPGDMLPLFSAGSRLERALRRMRWERGMPEVSPILIHTALQEIEGGFYGANRRWIAERKKMLWGFD